MWPSPGPRSPGYWNDYINTNTFTQLSIQVFGVAEVGVANNWTNPSSAKWESPFWSLGMLPAYDQTVNIANDGYKAVNIDNTTLANFPGSMTVGSLGISAPTNGLSTLLLNYFGQSTPPQGHQFLLHWNQRNAPEPRKQLPSRCWRSFDPRRWDFHSGGRINRRDTLGPSAQRKPECNQRDDESGSSASGRRVS